MLQIIVLLIVTLLVVGFVVFVFYNFVLPPKDARLVETVNHKFFIEIRRGALWDGVDRLDELVMYGVPNIYVEYPFRDKDVAEETLKIVKNHICK